MIRVSIDSGPHAGEVVDAATIEDGIRALLARYPDADDAWWSAHDPATGVRSSWRRGTWWLAPGSEPEGVFPCGFCHASTTPEDYRTHHHNGGCLDSEAYADDVAYECNQTWSTS